MMQNDRIRCLPVIGGIHRPYKLLSVSIGLKLATIALQDQRHGTLDAKRTDSHTYTGSHNPDVSGSLIGQNPIVGHAVHVPCNPGSVFFITLSVFFYSDHISSCIQKLSLWLSGLFFLASQR